MSSLPPSARSDAPPFIVMDVMAAAADLEAHGRDIIHMEVGQPGAPAPLPALEAARAALKHGRLAYTEALGTRTLRERIARHYGETYNVDVPARRVMVTTGSSAAFNLIFLSAFDAGARIALPRPGYPAYRNLLGVLGLEAVEIAAGPDVNYVLTAEALAKAHAQKPLQGVLIASPANPTGTLTPADELERIISFCRDAGVRFISDEIYHGLVYQGHAETAAKFSGDVITVNSFSKYYCMAGWRVGWMVLPDNLLRPAERLSQSLYISVPEISQIAAQASFEAKEELDRIKLSYQRNRAVLLDALPKLGFTDLAPADGAFYVYGSIAKWSNDSMAFSKRMLEEAGVATTPGHDFDRVDGAHTLRFSFAGTEEAIAEGVKRLERWLG
ncbi:MAG: aminotransferase class I/II-fold pyridoxal phosphate-dependent enzyme [Caulobacterales bacterium]